MCCVNIITLLYMVQELYRQTYKEILSDYIILIDIPCGVACVYFDKSVLSHKKLMQWYNRFKCESLKTVPQRKYHKTDKNAVPQIITMQLLISHLICDVYNKKFIVRGVTALQRNSYINLKISKQ